MTADFGVRRLAAAFHGGGKLPHSKTRTPVPPCRDKLRPPLEPLGQRNAKQFAMDGKIGEGVGSRVRANYQIGAVNDPNAGEPGQVFIGSDAGRGKRREGLAAWLRTLAAGEQNMR